MRDFGKLVEYPAPPREHMVGIYVLMLGDEVMYVGQTKNMPSRLRQHQQASAPDRERYKNDFTFDRVLWFHVADECDLTAYEGAIARVLDPPHTKNVSGDESRDAEILKALGLGLDTSEAFKRRMAARRLVLGQKFRARIREDRLRTALFKSGGDWNKAFRLAAFIEAA